MVEAALLKNEQVSRHFEFKKTEDRRPGQRQGCMQKVQNGGEILQKYHKSSVNYLMRHHPHPLIMKQSITNPITEGVCLEAKSLCDQLTVAVFVCKHKCPHNHNIGFQMAPAVT